MSISSKCGENCKLTERRPNKRNEENFQFNLDTLFDVEHADPLKTEIIEEGEIFLEKQKNLCRPGCLAAAKKMLSERKERARPRKKRQPYLRKYIIVLLTPM